MAEMTFNTYKIFELGNFVDEKLRESGLYEPAYLTIPVDEEAFRKIDEDLYYRNNPGGQDFQPSDNEIILNFRNFTAHIVKKNKTE